MNPRDFKRAVFRFLAVLSIIAANVLNTPVYSLAATYNVSPVEITYQAHVQNISWQDPVKDGEMAGTQGQSLRMEALKIWLNNAPAGMQIKYRAHVQNIGWQDWVSAGGTAGTEGKALRMEAVQIYLENAPGYTVQYQAHVQNIGWQNWVADGETAGTTGQALRLEALRIRIVKVDNSVRPAKPQGLQGVAVNSNQVNLSWDVVAGAGSYNVYRSSSPTGPFTQVGTTTTHSYIDNKLTGANQYWYKVSGVNDIGEGDLSDAVVIAAKAPSVVYQAHVQNIGWQNQVKDGDVAGTTGKALRLEGIKISLDNPPPGVRIKYQAYVEGTGWQDWVYDGSMAGTEGKALRLEAIRIVLEGAPGYTVQYQAHVQNIGWQNWVSNGEMAGTTGKSLRLEALRIRIVGYTYGADSGTSSNPYGNDFYIGQLGYGTHQHFAASTGGDDSGGAFFNKDGASNATWVYGYWLLSGMDRAPAGTSPSDWGQQQAQAAVKAFNDMSAYYGSKVKKVIFVDVEDCLGGLKYGDYANNRAIYTAFVNWIRDHSTASPGTYSSPGVWNYETMGTFSPLTPGYYWVADYPGGTPDQSSLNTSNRFWVNFPQTNEQAQIWQYEGSPDYDVARSLPG